jgi:hypothetical protein
MYNWSFDKNGSIDISTYRVADYGLVLAGMAW